MSDRNLLEHLCKLEGLDFLEMKKYDNTTKSNIMAPLFCLSKTMTCNDDFIKLLVIRIYRKIKEIEHNAKLYKKKHDEYQYKELYQKNKIDISVSPNLSFQYEKKSKKMLSNQLLAQRILGKDKIMAELLYYELLNCGQTNCKLQQKEVDSIIFTIKNELDRYASLLYPTYTEDKEWMEHSEIVHLFRFPSNVKVVANSTEKRIEEFAPILDMLLKYLQKKYDVHIKYVVQEDVTYKFNWILFVVLL